MGNKLIYRFKNADGVKYKVFKGKPYIYEKGVKTLHPGYCDNPEGKNPKIVIHDNIECSQTEMEVIIEELTHAYFFDKMEKEVRPFSKTVADLLYQMGWRKIKD